MRILYNKTAGVLSETARTRLERILLQDNEATNRTLGVMFPQLIVTRRDSRIQITKKDGSIVLDILQDGTAGTKWVESAVNLRMTTR